MNRALWPFLASRVIRTLITMWLGVTLIFFAIRVVPGDPAEAVLGHQSTLEGLATLRRQMGLDQSLWVQYVQMLGKLVQGDLGLSLVVGQPISQMILQVAPFTALVVVGALLIGVGIGLPLGIAAATARNSPIDYAARLLSLTGLVIPGFVIGILLMLPFSVWLGWFPVVGGGERGDWGSLLRFAVLPSAAGGVGMAAYLTRLTRSVVLELLREDYVRTARAKGLSERWILYKHVLRNALIPIVTFIGFYAIIMIGDSIAIEIVFSRPGFGRLILGGLAQRDYVLLQSVLLTYVLLAVLINFVVDILYTWIDPRVRMAEF
jgi:ABC-type dipeptide/oligopeptide/nickel transport system permease component